MKTILKLSMLIVLISCTNKKSDITTGNQGTIVIDSIQFQFVREGKGEPLVVIGTSAYYLKAFSDNLKNQFEMIFIDSRHFIPSYDPTDEELESLDLTTWADDIEIIRREMKLKDITIIGHSIHAQIAIDYATKYPDNLSRLVVIGGLPYSADSLYWTHFNQLWTTKADENRKKIMEANRPLLDSILQITPLNEHWAVRYKYNTPLYWVDPDYDISYLLKDFKTSPKAWNKLTESIPAKEEVVTKLDDLKIPVVVILGKLDFAVPYTVWEQLLSEVQNKNITYYLIEGASHNPHTEETTVKEFDEILSSWISDN